MWHGTASEGDKNYMWYYRPRSLLKFTEQERYIPDCWMNVDPPHGAKPAVLKAIRAAKRS
jgi:hypothetical protein